MLQILQMLLTKTTPQKQNLADLTVIVCGRSGIGKSTWRLDNVIDNLCRKVPPHEELRDETSVDEAPAF